MLWDLPPSDPKRNADLVMAEFDAMPRAYRDLANEFEMVKVIDGLRAGIKPDRLRRILDGTEPWSMQSGMITRKAPLLNR